MAKLEDSLSSFTITNKYRFSVELWYGDKLIGTPEPEQTSARFTETGTYQALEIIQIIPPPQALLEVVVIRLPGAVDNTYTTTRKIGNFLVEIDFEGSN